MIETQSPAPPSEGLRDRLVTAAIALLDEGGPTGLTLRQAAARAGVSHAAPAHHFDGLAGLQTAVAERAFALFCAAMLHRRETAAPEPFAQLLAICDGYLDFARDHGGLFHVMFACGEVMRDDPGLCAQSAAAYAILREGCLPFAGATPDPELEVAVWSAVHGYAALRNALPANQPADLPPPPFAAVLRRLLGQT